MAKAVFIFCLALIHCTIECAPDNRIASPYTRTVAEYIDSDLCFDFENLEYISSAGLRVLLAAQKIMNRQGSMVIRHVNETIMEETLAL